MMTENVFAWFWPLLSLLLAIALAWSLRRQHKLLQTLRPITKTRVQKAEVEDALRAAHALQSAEGGWTPEQLAEALGISDMLAEEIAMALDSLDWAEKRGAGRFCLTNAGLRRTAELVRAHRLLELYLADRQGMALESVHAEAHRQEHQLGPQELEQLDAELGYPAWDPHGHAIPSAGQDVPEAAGQALSDAAVPGSRLRIVRLDDEPTELLSQLVVLGLEPGTVAKVSNLDRDLVQLELNGAIVPLSFEAASHIYVVPAPAEVVPLGELAVGSRAQVIELAGEGKLQRRMLSMGFVPGAGVEVIRQAPLGDPLQYRVKSANVALRRTEANTLMVKELET